MILVFSVKISEVRFYDSVDWSPQAAPDWCFKPPKGIDKNIVFYSHFGTIILSIDAWLCNIWDVLQQSNLVMNITHEQNMNLYTYICIIWYVFHCCDSHLASHKKIDWNSRCLQAQFPMPWNKWSAWSACDPGRIPHRAIQKMPGFLAIKTPWWLETLTTLW